MTTRVYTIGYDKRTLADVCDLLSQYHIEYLIDVRSIPISRFQPEFSRDALESKINRAGLRYVFMGNLLGGRPSDQTCYTGGRVDYEKLKTLNTYQQGIRR